MTFGTTFLLSEGGVPRESNGRLVLANRAHVIRELSPEEYRWQKAHEARLLSSFLMCFYLAFALHFSAAPEEKREDTPQRR